MQRMHIVNENTTLVVNLAFTDEDGNPVTPSALRWRLDDVATGDALSGWQDITPLSDRHDLVIAAGHNAICNEALESERKHLTVEITYGTDNKKATADYIYAARNLSKID